MNFHIIASDITVKTGTTSDNNQNELLKFNKIFSMMKV